MFVAGTSRKFESQKTRNARVRRMWQNAHRPRQRLGLVDITSALRARKLTVLLELPRSRWCPIFESIRRSTPTNGVRVAHGRIANKWDAIPSIARSACQMNIGALRSREEFGELPNRMSGAKLWPSPVRTRRRTKTWELSVLTGTFRSKTRHTPGVGHWSGRRAAWYASERGGRAGTRRPFFLSFSISPFPLDRLFSHNLLQF